MITTKPNQWSPSTGVRTPNVEYVRSLVAALWASPLAGDPNVVRRNGGLSITIGAKGHEQKYHDVYETQTALAQPDAARRW